MEWKEMYLMMSLSLLAMSGCTGDKQVLDAPSLPQLSYEVVPGAGIPLGPEGATPDVTAASYEEKLTLTQDAVADIVPDVFAAVGASWTDATTELSPGGYLLDTSPSLQTRISLEDDELDRLAAALGLSLNQWSVLVTDYRDVTGGTTYGIVSFEDSDLTPDLAQRFFVHAADIDPGLDGGYSSFGDTVTFINLRGSDGEPYSDLEDDVFISQLEEAADTFSLAETVLVTTGEADAHLVENDWELSPAGEDYIDGYLAGDSVLVETVTGLQSAHSELVLDLAEVYGW